MKHFRNCIIRWTSFVLEAPHRDHRNTGFSWLPSPFCCSSESVHGLWGTQDSQTRGQVLCFLLLNSRLWLGHHHRLWLWVPFPSCPWSWWRIPLSIGDVCLHLDLPWFGTFSHCIRRWHRDPKWWSNYHFREDIVIFLELSIKWFDFEHFRLDIDNNCRPRHLFNKIVYGFETYQPSIWLHSKGLSRIRYLVNILSNWWL